MKIYRLLTALKCLLFFCWPIVARAAEVSFDQALQRITWREWTMVALLSTLAGVAALLFKVSNIVNAAMRDNQPVTPIPPAYMAVIISAQMVGSWLAGIVAFFLSAKWQMDGLLVGFFVPIVAFGGARSLELLYEKFFISRVLPTRRTKETT